jgi:uncharacterized protein Yka (UPF0111/DUF47 family)
MSMLRSSSNGTSGLLVLFEESGRNVERTGSLLRELLDDFPEHSSLARDILICEQEGDRITHDIIHEMTLNGSKLDQRDAYELARALDDVVDYAEETADSLELYGVEAPMEQAQELAAVLADASVSVASALTRMRAGEDISSELIEIHRLENEGDRISREAIASLFKSGTDPMVVIRWKDIFESLEQAIDSCETVAHVIEGMRLKRR